MASPFAQILEGTDRALVVAEDEYFVAVVEAKALVLGHVIIISKKEVDHWCELSNEALSDLLQFSKPIACALEKIVPCRKVGIAVLGLETRHAHLHLVPMQSADDLNFTRAKLVLSKQELLSLCNRLKLALG